MVLLEEQVAEIRTSLSEASVDFEVGFDQRATVVLDLEVINLGRFVIHVVYYQCVVNYLHLDQVLRCEGHLCLVLVDKGRIKFKYEDATKERIGMQHDDFVVQAGEKHLMLLPPDSCVLLLHLLLTLLLLRVHLFSLILDGCLQVLMCHGLSQAESDGLWLEVLHCPLRE